MVEKGKQVNTYVRNMQNCNCFHISIYLHLLASICKHEKGIQRTFSGTSGASLRWFLKALVWFWLIDETLSANLVYQDDYEIGSTTPSDEAMAKIMTMVMA